MQQSFVMYTVISIVAFTFIVSIAYLILHLNNYNPVEENGDDFLENKKTLSEHFVNWGLVYPAAYVYIWMALYCIFKECGLL